jgi:ABC-type branched-subunit amino acid transport system substrate-binding protein
MLENLASLRPAVVFNEDDPDSVEIKDFLIREFERNNNSLSIVEAYNKGTEDFYPLLLRLTEQDPTAVILPVNAHEAALIYSQARELGIGQTRTFIVSENWIRDRARAFNFSIRFSNAYRARIVTEYALRSLGIRRAGILYNKDNLNSAEIAEILVTSFQNSGGSIYSIESFTEGTIDFRLQLLNLRDKNLDALILPVNSKEAVFILNQAMELGMSMNFIGSENWPGSEFIKNGGSAVEGALFLSQYDLTSPDIQVFNEKYKRRFGLEPEYASYFMYDSVKALEAALKQPGSLTGISVSNALEAININGLSSRLRFDTLTHLPQDNRSAIFKITGGQFAILQRFAD